MIDNLIQEGIINTTDVKTLQDKAAQAGRRIVFLDATFILPNSDEDIFENFIDARLPNAVFFDIKAIKDKTSPLPHMLPSAEDFSVTLSTMGIRNDDIVITYGQHGMIMGPARVWWMFRGFGHSEVLALNGGLPAWQTARLETHNGELDPAAPTQYSAQPFNAAMLSDMSGIIAASDGNTCPILDARPANRFDGSAAEPRAAMRSGHIPNSMNAPAKSLVDEHGLLKSKEDIRQIIENAGIDLTQNKQRIITSCGSGITACALTLALHHIGYRNVSVYDGSWSEWGLESSPTKVFVG